MKFNPLKSKTFWGLVISAAAWIVKQPHIDVATILQGAGGLIVGTGLRDAIAQLKAGA